MGSIKWLGHSGFEIELANKILLIDPWLTDNPLATMKASEIEKTDIVCVTHDHGDHLGDAIEICKRTGATFVGIYELAVFVEEQGVKDVVGINIGGTVDIEGIIISMVQAFHSSTRGAPTGFIIKAEGTTIYHTGDTGLFGDLKLIGEVYRPDVALVPIGNHYTMGPEEAAKAVKLIRPDVVIPMHYQTFPVLKPSAADFTKLVREKTPEVKVVALKIGEVSQL